MMTTNKIKLYFFLFFVLLAHQLFLINTKSQHGCGADLPLNFFVQAKSFENTFSGYDNFEYNGAFLKIDCDVVDVITPTGDPARYLLLENSNTIERPLHNIMAIPFRYISTFFLELLNIDIKPTEFNSYSSSGSFNVRSFYLSWYYAHLFQNILLIFISYYLFSKLFKLNYFLTFLFYLIFYLPNLGKDILSPDMNMWIPVSILLNLYLLKIFNNSTLRKRVLIFTSFTILIYPIFVINYFFYTLIATKKFITKNLSFKTLVIEGLSLVAPYILYRLFLLQRDLQFSPISWQCLNENNSIGDFCYGVWIFVKVNNISDFVNYLSEAFSSAARKGDLNNFALLLIFACILFFYSKKRKNYITNSDYLILVFCIMIVLILIGVFNERYINYLPTTMLFYLINNREFKNTIFNRTLF
tara:strand:+ start:2310 stop:3551 length:1242 start_codon:yes stop_codon:yes gene_type:complete